MGTDYYCEGGELAYLFDISTAFMNKMSDETVAKVKPLLKNYIETQPDFEAEDRAEMIAEFTNEDIMSDMISGHQLGEWYADFMEYLQNAEYTDTSWAEEIWKLIVGNSEFARYADATIYLFNREYHHGEDISYDTYFIELPVQVFEEKLTEEGQKLLDIVGGDMPQTRHWSWVSY